jgi:hypothetical protein
VPIGLIFGSLNLLEPSGSVRPVELLLDLAFTGYIAPLLDFVRCHVVIIFVSFYTLCHFKKCYFLAQIEPHFLFYIQDDHNEPNSTHIKATKQLNCAGWHFVIYCTVHEEQ